MKDIPQLNEHNKEEYPPMHTTEHILNQTMIRLFGCGRAVSAHIERKKSFIVVYRNNIFFECMVAK